MARREGRLCMLLGLLLLIAAFSLTGYNLWEENRAARSARQVLSQMEADLPGPEAQPAYLVAPEMEMPVLTIDDHRYVGDLYIPRLELSLPVMDRWSYPNLKLAPCRYSGSAYLDNLIIAGHNYKKQFGVLKNLQLGDKIVFTDMDNNRFRYVVSEILVLEPTAVEALQAGAWDLTLFTCTMGGQSRVTVRCVRQMERVVATLAEGNAQ